jgi:L-ribulose-5-phosphate 4-epimerase
MSPYQEIKEACCQANRMLPQVGLVDLTFGNVSVANAGKTAFAIKPSGIDYGALTAEDMVVMDFSGKVLEGKWKPSSDTPTHGRLLQAFPQAFSVVHTHSRNATAWAQAGLDIPCLGTTHADYFFGEVPVTRRLTEAEIAEDYEWETGNVIVERFQSLNPSEVRAVLVHGHGPFTWGSSWAQAVENARALEIVAEMAWKVRTLDPLATPISKHLLDKHFKRKHGANAYYGQKEKGLL